MDRSNIYPPADGNKPLPQANRPSHLIVDNGYNDRVEDFDEMQWISFILSNVNIKSEMKSKFISCTSWCDICDDRRCDNKSIVHSLYHCKERRPFLDVRCTPHSA